MAGLLSVLNVVDKQLRGNVLEMLTSALLAAALFGVGLVIGWRAHAMLRDRRLEMRAQAAKIEHLQAALADSQKRSARQADWLKSLEAELTLAKGNEGTTQAPHFLRKALMQ